MASSRNGINGHGTSENGLTPLVHEQSEHSYDLSYHSSVVSPSPVSNGYSHHLAMHNQQQIINHVYQAGFENGLYADTIVNVRHRSYSLHAIILSRSPLLAHLMSTSPPTGGQRVIFVQLDHEPEVTEEGLGIALGYLYSSVSLSLVRLDNARSVLAAACLLGGMDELCVYAYEFCRQSITLQTIEEWLQFVSKVICTSDGSPCAEVPMTVFGQYAWKLRGDVFHFLVDTLPKALGISPSVAECGSSEGRSGRDTLLQIFSSVPFDMFKAAVESSAFEIGSDQNRFKFARDAIELRKKGNPRGEETVVLAFGGGHNGGSAVHITRKTLKRQLWKVHSRSN